MNETLLSLVHEKDKFNGTAELLDILASIISGYAVPIRQEHITFFETILIPMHKVQSSPEFYEQLLRCTMLFAIKDNNLCVTILEGLLKFWPFANRTKECLFLTSVYEALTACNPETIKHLVPRLFKRIVKCVSSNDVQVADRAPPKANHRLHYLHRRIRQEMFGVKVLEIHRLKLRNQVK